MQKPVHPQPNSSSLYHHYTTKWKSNGFTEFYQIWFKRVESKNNISQFPFKVSRKSEPKISNIPTNPEKRKEKKETILRQNTEENAWQNTYTVFARYRQGSDGAAQVGNEDTHCSIVEFEELWLRVRICHWNFFETSEDSVGESCCDSGERCQSFRLR